jgi:carbamate kinase
MGPKIRSVSGFLRAGGERAVITSAARAARALRSTDPADTSAGTRVVPATSGAGLRSGSAR